MLVRFVVSWFPNDLLWRFASEVRTEPYAGPLFASTAVLASFCTMKFRPGAVGPCFKAADIAIWVEGLLPCGTYVEAGVWPRLVFTNGPLPVAKTSTPN